MKRALRTAMIVAIAAVAATAIACIGPQAPSRTEAESAITQFVNIPVGGWAASTRRVVERTDVVSIGQFVRTNEKGGYWPVTARVAGTVERGGVLTQGKGRFDRTVQFRVYKDEKGTWRATMFPMFDLE